MLVTRLPYEEATVICLVITNTMQYSTNQKKHEKLSTYQTGDFPNRWMQSFDLFCVGKTCVNYFVMLKDTYYLIFFFYVCVNVLVYYILTCYFYQVQILPFCNDTSSVNCHRFHFNIITLSATCNQV